LSALFAAILLSIMAASSSPAQSPPRRVAVFTLGLTFDPVFQGLQEGLVRSGYSAGKNISFVVEDTKGSSDNLEAKAQKLVSAKPDALFAVTTAHALAAKKATTTVPIVFSWVRDPVLVGLVGSFSSSRNNLTGVMTGADALSGKRLEVLLQVAPKVKRPLVLVATNDNIALSSFRYLEETAKKLGVQLARHDVVNDEDIKKALRDTPKGSVDAIFHIPSQILTTYVDLLIEKAKTDKIPFMAHEDSIAAKGALLGYGANFRSVGSQAARLVAKVLTGEKPADIPSELPEKLMLSINLSTAKQIGLKIPPAVLEQADRLLE
jgi:putative ABC transport system substrate-binding protein